MELGAVNVLIGENGAGKSNILEAIAFAAASHANKLDHEFLSARGVRVTAPEMMRSAFRKAATKQPIRITLTETDGDVLEFEIQNRNKPYTKWADQKNLRIGDPDRLKTAFVVSLEKYAEHASESRMKDLFDSIQSFAERVKATSESIKQNPNHIVEPFSLKLTPDFHFNYEIQSSISDFVIYSPENSSLRILEREGQIEPLGINGEGLLRLLTIMSDEPQSAELAIVKDGLKKFGWFSDFDVVANEDHNSTLKIKDRFISTNIDSFDQRSANEGFLFVAFYLALFSSRLTPKIFAIDNIDASLNPKLCRAIIELLGNVARQTGKQVICTSHNPAILDGINLNDDQQRLFIVARDDKGKTTARRFTKTIPEGRLTRMSELFMRGVIGGLPKGF